MQEQPAPNDPVDQAATSQRTEGASPHPTDAAAKSANPAVKTRFAPIRSPSAPADRISAANATVYAFTTHCSAVRLPPRLAPIGFTATLTTLTSNCTTA